MITLLKLNAAYCVGKKLLDGADMPCEKVINWLLCWIYLYRGIYHKHYDHDKLYRDYMYISFQHVMKGVLPMMKNYDITVLYIHEIATIIWIGLIIYDIKAQERHDYTPPTTRYNKPFYENNTGCPICLEEFSRGESVYELECRHIFHDRCILEWLKEHGKCAYCYKEC